jgi:hypothetical protein
LPNVHAFFFVKQSKIYLNKRQSTLSINEDFGNGYVQCCGSGMFILDPDFYPSWIPDPKTATKERGEKKFVIITFYVATNFTKLKSILVLKC